MPQALPRPHRSTDPNKLTRKPLNNGVPAFTFFMIENVDVVDATHIIAGNDYKLILLEVGRFPQGAVTRQGANAIESIAVCARPFWTGG
jgi:hypothetical protein